MNTKEKPYRVETYQVPFGKLGGYNSWIELVTPNFSLLSHDPNLEIEEVKKLATKLNKSVEMEKAI